MNSPDMPDEATTRADWNEAAYLGANPDVASAVAKGEFPDGYAHYVRHGKAEGRAGTFRSGTLPQEQAWTRLCADPWTYAEIAHDLQVKPCCNYHGLEALPASGAQATSFRNGPAMRELRMQLLSGNLSPRCRGCHIREKAPLAALGPWLQREIGARQDPADPAELEYLRVDITTDCNLRCVYCAVSQPGYVGTRMPDEALDTVRRLALETSRLKTVMVNGHGETTTHPAWMSFCEPLLERGLRLTIISNLAKDFSAAEIGCLARFHAIQLSVDSADPLEVRTVRRKARLEHLLFNITRIRMAAREQQVRGPNIQFSCGVYDRNSAGLPDYARMAVAMKIHAVTFWNLVKYPDIPGAVNVQAVDTSNRRDLVFVIERLEEACSILDQAGIRYEIAGEFLKEWKSLAGLAK